MDRRTYFVLFFSFYYCIGTTRAQGVDFMTLCEKATGLPQMQAIVQCFMKNVPVKIIGIYDACVKMMSNADFVAFLKLVCEKKPMLDKWVKCQANKFRKEYTPSAADEKMMEALPPCIAAIN